MEARRYLRCLGQPALFSPSGELVRFRTKKHLAVLVYLAVEDRQVRRDRLAELLWPSVPAAEGRHSLATALSALRPRLGPGGINASRDHVQLPRGILTLDTDRLLAGDVLGTQTTEQLEIAGFLDGFEIPDSSEFALWKDRHQARLLPRIMSALELLIESCRRHGDMRQIEHLASRMLALDELCEEAVRAQMEVLALSGDRLSALKVYERWRLKLDEELSATPSEQLVSMAAQLRKRGWEATPVIDIPTPPLDQRRVRPFVGRSIEYKVLYDAWEDVRAKRRGHVMVLGDSGVGKTTLVERFTTAASLEGAVVSRVQGYDLEREIPYATVAGLVVGLLDRPEVLGTPPEALANLSRIAPQVRQRFGSIPQPRDTQGETTRIELTEALHQLLEALAENSPVILVVDDLHLADDASLAVLHLLVRRALDQRTMLILIARPGELALGRQSRHISEMASDLRFRELELQPLSYNESSELLTQLSDGSSIAPSLPIRRALLEAAAGYPMVLELLFQDWQTQGTRSVALALEAMTVDMSARTEHAGAYPQLLSRIVRTVDPATRTVLHLASILGPRINDLQMYSLASLSLGQTMAGLAQLVDLRVLRDDSRGLEFVNELVRAEVYESVPSPVRMALHGAIADRLLASEGSMAHASGLEVAWHCVRAGRQDQATPHLLRGARQAMRHGASHVAERALESALPAIVCEEHLEMMLLLAEALQEQGRWRESLDRLAAMPSSCAQDLRWRGIVLSAIAVVNMGASLVDDARSKIPTLMTILRESMDGRTRVTAARVLAHFASVYRDSEAATNVLTLVDGIRADALDEDAQGKLALTRGMLLWVSGDVAASYDQVSRTVDTLMQKRTQNIVTVQLIAGLGVLSTHQGEYEKARSHYVLALDMASRLGNDTQVASILANMAICHGRLGDYPEQLRLCLSAPRPWGAEFGGLIEVQLSYSQALALVMLGRPDDAIRTTAKLDERIQGEFPPWMLQAWLLWKADILLCAGRVSEALPVARRAVHHFGFELQTPAFAGPFARWIGHLGRSETDRSELVRSMVSLLARLGSYDAVDEVEVMCAGLSLDMVCGQQAEEYRETIQERLLALPAEVTSHLKRLGSLS